MNDTATLTYTGEACGEPIVRAAEIAAVMQIGGAK